MESTKLQLLFHVFPKDIQVKIQQQLETVNTICEIRFRVNCPIVIICSGQSWIYLGKHDRVTKSEEEAYCMSKEQLAELFEYISNYSMYAYEHEISQGFLTVQGGHRIGIAGKTIWDQNGIRNIYDITSLNIRVAKEHIGSAKTIFPYLIDKYQQPYSTLIASAPGCGKTSLLRDIIRLLGTPDQQWNGCNVGVVDERSEIAACYRGVPQNQIGIYTDILDACPKSTGIHMLLRSMAPRVIAVDELGKEEDFEAIKTAFFSGCALLATVHVDRYENIFQKKAIVSLLEYDVRRLIVLGQNKAKRFEPVVYDLPSGKILSQ